MTWAEIIRVTVNLVHTSRVNRSRSVVHATAVQSIISTWSQLTRSPPSGAGISPLAHERARGSIYATHVLYDRARLSTANRRYWPRRRRTHKRKKRDACPAVCAFATLWDNRPIGWSDEDPETRMPKAPWLSTKLMTSSSRRTSSYVSTAAATASSSACPM